MAKIAESVHGRVLRELHGYYSETLRLSEYAERLGALLCVVQIVMVCFSLLHTIFILRHETLTMFGS